MPVPGVQRFVQPDYSALDQDGSTYPVYIDRAIAVLKRAGAAFAPHQVYSGSPNPDLAVEVDAGYIWNGSTLTEVAAQTVAGFTIPSAGQNRVDRIVLDAVTGAASRVAGTPVTGSPTAVAPAIPVGKLPCAQVTIDSSSTAVLNSMITDERVTGLTKAPVRTRQVLTSGTSATYTRPAGCTAINVRMVGPGGGGAAQTSNAGAAGSGATTFGTLSAGPGGGGAVGAAGGTGGTAANGDINIDGAAGDGGGTVGATGGPAGGSGGRSVFGGNGGAPQANSPGLAAKTNSGSGGSGAGANAGVGNAGGGGGAGAYVEKLIVSPDATYTYTIGTGGAGATAGTHAGGAGADGMIIIDEFYN